MNENKSLLDSIYSRVILGAVLFVLLISVFIYMWINGIYSIDNVASINAVSDILIEIIATTCIYVGTWIFYYTTKIQFLRSVFRISPLESQSPHKSTIPTRKISKVLQPLIIRLINNSAPGEATRSEIARLYNLELLTPNHFQELLQLVATRRLSEYEETDISVDKEDEIPNE